MKKYIALGTALAICALAAVVLSTERKIPVVHAQAKGCDVTSLSGPYGYSLTGLVYDNQGNQYILGSAGRVAPDGAGNLSGADTFSLDGTVSTRTYTGTYTVNSDCTGSMVLNTPNPIGATNFDFVLINNGKKINVVQHNDGFILTGVFELITQ